MPWITDEQISKARRIDLLSYLQANEPGELVRDGSNRYKTVSHGSLIISNGKWVWNQGQVGGVSALDYLVKVRGMGFTEAVERLTDTRAVIPVATPEKPLTSKQAFSPPKPTSLAVNTVAYLQDRGIHPGVIGKCISAGTLYEARHNGSVVCVFTGADERGKTRFACMRGIFSDLKQDAAGSDKRFSFNLPAQNGDSGNLAVFESPIDALSHASLGLREGWDWDGHRLSLGGTSPAALMAFLERNPQISRVALCLDNDDAGRAAAVSIRDMMAADSRFFHIRVTVNLPCDGKDYNDALLRAIRGEREHKQHSRPSAAISV